MGVERAVRIPDIEGKANVVVGMRRCGKTYLLFQEMRRLLREGVPWKVYPVDPGLASAYRPGARQPTGQLLETAVFLELQRRRYTVHYVRTSTGREVDFHAVDAEGRPQLIQVCADPSVPETDTRERGTLLEAMAELGHDRGTVVTLTHEETRTDDGVAVHYVPAWKWLLDHEGPR
jgi:predicted AAA+ superfamily ATPase